MGVLQMWERRIGTTLALVVLAAGAVPPAVNAVVISEFMAANVATIIDEDGSAPDWIEIYNDEETTVNLAGWGLTDDPDEIHKWRFPDVEIKPGRFLLVFASGKDRAKPGAELHTNFRLLAPGGYLALRDVQGRVTSAFSPTYPEQMRDTSYGFKMDMSRTELVGPGAAVTYLVPENNDLALSWTERDFADDTWTAGATGIGFDIKAEPTYHDVIQTDVTAVMQDVNSSIYIRIPFTLSAEEVAAPLRLKLQYADGFVAYVNGTEVARGNTRTTTNYNARARTNRSPQDALSFETHVLSDLADVLQPGENVLAIHAMSYSSRDTDFFVSPLLETFQIIAVSQRDFHFFLEPSPGLPNGEGFARVAPRPEFSVASTAFSEPFELTLTAPEGAEIRYTLLNSAAALKGPARVTQASTLYEGPLTIDTNVMVRARVFQQGFLPSPVAEAHYILMHQNLIDFSSNLPVVIITTFSQSIPGTDTIGFPTPVHCYIIERGKDGRAHMTGEVHHASLCGIKVRGSSTAGRQKQSWSIEMQDPDRWVLNPERANLYEHPDKEYEILGLPLESDFVLYGAYNFDQALMRNAFIYEISNQVGQYAARTRFCEVWLNRGTGVISTSHYMGVYSFMERLTRNVNRINIRPIYPTENEEPEVTGGYILKQDRADPGEGTFSAGGYTGLNWVYPDAHEVTPQQRSYLVNYLNQVNAAVRSRDPERYGQLIDIDAWVDHHILNMFPRNLDAFRLSGYMYKDREGKLVMGPIWDYDRSMDSTDTRDDPITQWDSYCWNNGDCGTWFFRYNWYGPLFNNQPPLGDDPWAVRYRQRWNELRGGPLSTENLLGVIDGMAAEIGEAAERNWTRWRQGNRNFDVPVNHLKNWLTLRMDWIDTQFFEPPVISPTGGPVEEGTMVTISAPEGQIYYTIDGPDPRGAGSNPAAEAVLYTEPIHIMKNTRIRARARMSATLWSSMVEESYYTSLLPLVITEVMYNPPPDQEGQYGSLYFEFIELLNIGDEELDLRGVEFVNIIKFKFAEGDVTSLGAGEYVVVVRNLEAFHHRYGEETGIRIAGEVTGTLSNTRARIELRGPAGEPLMDFTYLDDWFPSTDGQGHSLVIKNPFGSRNLWNTAEGWQPSVAVEGSPGQGEAGGMQLPGDFNQDGRLTVSDAVGLLSYLAGLRATEPCASPGGTLMLLDANGDAHLNIADAVYILSYLFTSGEGHTLGTACVEIPGCDEICSP